jgi:hypothetical protein
MNSVRIHRCVKALVPFVVLAASYQAYPQTNASESPLTIVEGSLEEIRTKPRARILVVRPRVVDAGDAVMAVAEAVQAGQETERRQRRAYNVIAHELNKYMRKYRRIEPADDPSKADYVVAFNLIRYQWILGRVYASGEMFVVSSQPGVVRVLWRAKKEMLAEDAVKKLVSDMKVVHGIR